MTQVQRLKIAALLTIACIIAADTMNSSAGGNVSPAADPAAEPAAVFKSKCASCHGADGSGNTAAGKSLKCRDLRAGEAQGLSDEQLYQLIAKGKGKMPGYEKSLGADTCKALVGYIRQLAKK